MIGLILFALLSISSPKDGVTVPTLRDGQRAYLDRDRKARFAAIDDAKERSRLFSVGATQKPVYLEWVGPTNVSYSFSIGYDGGAEEEFSISGRNSIYVTNLELGRKYRWLVRNDETGEFVMSTFWTEVRAPRLLKAGGVSNFRDLGGWKGKDGKRVKQNMIFRSAGLRSSSKSKGGLISQGVEVGARRVSDAGIITLQHDFKIKTDMELRTVQECAGMGGSVLPNAEWCHVPFAAYDFIDNMIRGKEPFAKLFRTFLNADSYPILVHCSGGRDRTGTLCFLLNGLLGVSEEDLLRDWEMSIFSDQGVNFNSDRISRLTRYLHTLPGNDITEKVESYVRSCGITEQEVALFRALMLE